MISVNNLEKSFAGQLLFKGLSFNLSSGEKIGLVGRNGSGKSTLLKILSRIEEEDSGTINIPKNYSIGFLKQHLEFSKDNIVDEVMSALPQSESENRYKAEKLLFGLGFEKNELGNPPNSFSGGFQIRLNLAKLLIQEHDLLLLDEPTNYLDIVSIKWLKSFLNSYSGEFILVTHDRDFMDSVCNCTMGIVNNSLKKFRGNTFKFYEQVEIEEEISRRTRKNIEAKKAHLEKFIERFKAKASKATQAQSRVKQLAKLESAPEEINEKDLLFRFNYSEMPAKYLGEAQELSFGYENGRPLFSDLSFSIKSKDRIGIIGKNGQGKSTLLKLLANELKPNGGNISYHSKVRVGHFAQTNVSSLSNEHSIVQEIQSVNDSLSTTQVRDICGTMLFEGEAADKKIKVLSGGEKSRVMLGKILATDTNYLLLDEPTNHLDMYSIEALAGEINSYKGALVVVTHNELLLRSFATKLIVFRNGNAELFEGTYDDFLNKLGWGEAIEAEKSESVPKLSRKELKRLRSELVLKRSAALKPLKSEHSELEETIVKSEEKVEKIRESLDKFYNGDKSFDVAELSKELSLTEDLIEKSFLKLEEVDNKIEEEEKKYGELLDELS